VNLYLYIFFIYIVQHQQQINPTTEASSGLKEIEYDAKRLSNKGK